MELLLKVFFDLFRYRHRVAVSAKDDTVILLDIRTKRMQSSDDLNIDDWAISNYAIKLGLVKQNKVHLALPKSIREETLYSSKLQYLSELLTPRLNWKTLTIDWS